MAEVSHRAIRKYDKNRKAAFETTYFSDRAIRFGAVADARREIPPGALKESRRRPESVISLRERAAVCKVLSGATLGDYREAQDLLGQLIYIYRNVTAFRELQSMLGTWFLESPSRRKLLIDIAWLLPGRRWIGSLIDDPATRCDGIILCDGVADGGAGPAQRRLHKAAFKLNGIDLLSRSVDLLSSAPVQAIFLAGRKQGAIKRCTQSSNRYQFVHNAMTDGIGPAITKTAEKAKGDTLIICSVDEVVLRADIERMARFHFEHGAMATVLCRAWNMPLGCAPLKAAGDRVLMPFPSSTTADIGTRLLVDTGVLMMSVEAAGYIDNSLGTGWESVKIPLIQMGQLMACVQRGISSFRVNPWEQDEALSRLVQAERRQ